MTQFIPEGWKDGRLSCLIKKLDAGVSVNSEDKPSKEGEFGVLKTSCVSGDYFNLDENKVVKCEGEVSRLKEPLTQGCIVVSRMNTPQLVGANAYVSVSRDGLYLPDRLWQAKPQKEACMKWIAYFLKLEKTKFTISNLATGTSGSMKNITKGDFLSIPLYIPPLAEQKKIAEILGTWDEAIENVEKQIAGAKAQKKALMQQLLSARTRFPHFTDDWQTVKLGDVGATYTGLSGKNKDDFGAGKAYIPYTNIFNNSSVNMRKLELVQIKEGENQYTVAFGDIFFTTSSETPIEVGMSSVMLERVDDVYLNSFCFGFRPHDLEITAPQFMRYFMRSNDTRRSIVRLAQGSTRYNLSKSGLLKIELTLPSLDEQKAIAQVLDVADAEITNLQAQLEKLKTQKKGLMQQLLTGKTRVQVDKEAA